MVRWLVGLAERGITWLRTEHSLDEFVEEIVHTRPGLVTILMGEPHIAFGLLAGRVRSACCHRSAPASVMHSSRESLSLRTRSTTCG